MPKFFAMRAAARLVPALMLAAACSDMNPVSVASTGSASSLTRQESKQLARELRLLARGHEIGPVPAAPDVSEEMRHLGQMLVFDKVLSGNSDISCMTCHHPDLGLGDDRSQAIGQGGTGLGAARTHPQVAFIPRNAPPLFNLHLAKSLFWDGRVAVDESGRFETPAGDQLTPDMTAVFEFGAASALGLFPVLSREEMRGQPGENELADIPDADMRGVWAAAMRRLGRIPQYRTLFEEAYPGTRFDDMSFAHATNAMGGFIVSSFASYDSPWDRFLAGQDGALTAEQIEGATKFMNAPCAQCHNGPGFSDGEFHNVALAQFGPGRGDGASGRDDFGRMNVTGDPADLYRFRSTMLRNVELTAPYGHAGEFADVAQFIDHYSSSADKLRAYSSVDIPELLLSGTLLEDNKEAIIASRDELILPVQFDTVFVRQVTAFMLSLTGQRARNLSHFTPRRVPSGLPVDR